MDRIMEKTFDIKEKKCKICGELFKPFKTTDRFCSLQCTIADIGMQPAANKRRPRKRIKVFSTSRKQENDKYTKMRADFMKINVICAIGSPECSSTCTEIHHIKGRIGKKLLDRAEWIGTCRACHDYIHHTSEGIKWAREKGFVKSRIYPDMEEYGKLEDEFG